MRHFLSTEDWSRSDLQAMLDRARLFRDSPAGDALVCPRCVCLMANSPSRSLELCIVIFCIFAL